MDLAPTIARWAGSDVSGYDGRSLASLLSGSPPQQWREVLLIEHFIEAEGGGVLRGPHGEVRLLRTLKDRKEGTLDLNADQYQLNNLFKPDQPNLPLPDPELVKYLEDRLGEPKSCSGDGCGTSEEVPYGPGAS